jgi:OmpA-OmpF porin, OOP family
MTTNGNVRSWYLVTILSLVAAAMIAANLVIAAAGTQSKTITAGEKAKISGRISERDVDTITISDTAGGKTVVLLTDTTSVRTNKKGLGIFRRGQEYAVTSLVRGLVVDVEGKGNEKGQLIADKVRFNESDLKTAMTVDSRVGPVEDANKKLSGQVAEVETVAKDARSDAAKANEGVVAANKRIDATNERISGLDNFDVKAEKTVYFAVNSYALTAEDKQALDDISKQALNAKGYMIEVAGFADSTGDADKNLALSQRRADTVVKYLAINGNIPMRRIVTPIGYGATRSVADDTTAEGRKMNRRVEVRMLVSRGL